MRTFNKKLNATATEEGTWTPTIQDASLSDGEGQTYSVQEGHYTVIGNRVFITGVLAVTSLGTLTGTDQAYIGGLPFSSSSSTNSLGNIYLGYSDGLSIVAGNVASGVVASSSTVITLRLWDNVSGTTPMLVSEISASGSLTFSGQYIL